MIEQFRTIRLFSSFSERDVEAVNYCFKFTASVIHSALAVQKERKLKDRTQVCDAR